MTLNPPDEKQQAEIIQALCHSHQSSPVHYKAYLRFYTSTCLERANAFVTTHLPIFQAHSDIIGTVMVLRNNAALPKESFQSLAFPVAPNAHERDLASRTTVKVAFMIDCASKDDYSDSYQLSGPFPVRWTAGETFIHFLQGAFPLYSPKQFQKGLFRNSLKAWKLKKRYGVRLVPTNDMVQHLIYDRQASSLKVFHHTAFLKAHLRHTSSLPLTASFEESVKLGSVAPQLLLETLLTIYHILLPLSIDHKSAQFAESLVDKHAFDPNLTVDDGSIRTIPPDFVFVYWAERLKVLEEVTANPPPANKLVSWMERHTSERNALTVAILGVFLAAFFGFLSFVVGVAQLVVSILAWKYSAT